MSDGGVNFLLGVAVEPILDLHHGKLSPHSVDR